MQEFVCLVRECNVKIQQQIKKRNTANNKNTSLLYFLCASVICSVVDVICQTDHKKNRLVAYEKFLFQMIKNKSITAI